MHLLPPGLKTMALLLNGMWAQRLHSHKLVKAAVLKWKRCERLELEQSELLEDSLSDRGKMDRLPLISDKIAGG